MLWIARKPSSPTSLRLLVKFSLSLSLPNSFLFPVPLSPPPPPAAYTTFPRFRPFSSLPSSPPSSLALAFIRGGCDDTVVPHRLPLSFLLCPGCGVYMQDSDPALPGFFHRPSPKSPDYRAPISPLPLSSASDSHVSLSLKSGHFQEQTKVAPECLADSDAKDEKPLVCARCHSLRYYGRVKVPSAENLLPDFDFDRMVAPKMTSPSGPRSVVLLVVDAADFDGSFPRMVARLLSASIDRNSHAWKENKPANIPRVIIVVTKVDLIPPSVYPKTLVEWTRRRAHVWGAIHLTGVHLVSAVRNQGVRDLVEHVEKLAGSRGNVWVVGAQNAGKSTLINAMGRSVEGKVNQLTEAPVPGTTLGIVRVEGILCGQTKLFDTPGILHPYHITTRLTREEQKLVHMSKELTPRTYRIKPGHSVHIGGLMRLDVEESSVNSIYLTVWASLLLPLHMGKIENASKMREDHFGRQLQPPIGEKRMNDLGKWVRNEFRVIGENWQESSTDIAVAGLGWIAVCLKGEVVLGVWTYEGIDIISRKPLTSIKARIFEEAGFTVSKIVSQADSRFNKEKQNSHKKQCVGIR